MSDKNDKNIECGHFYAEAIPYTGIIYNDPETGNFYLWDENRKSWYMASPIKVLPPEIRDMVLASKARAELVLRQPL